jgi:hypothetical protein
MATVQSSPSLQLKLKEILLTLHMHVCVLPALVVPRATCRACMPTACAIPEGSCHRLLTVSARLHEHLSLPLERPTGWVNSRRLTMNVAVVLFSEPTCMAPLHIYIQIIHLRTHMLSSTFLILVFRS